MGATYLANTEQLSRFFLGGQVVPPHVQNGKAREPCLRENAQRMINAVPIELVTSNVQVDQGCQQ